MFCTANIHHLTKIVNYCIGMETDAKHVALLLEESFTADCSFIKFKHKLHERFS